MRHMWVYLEYASVIDAPQHYIAASTNTRSIGNTTLLQHYVAPTIQLAKMNKRPLQLRFVASQPYSSGALTRLRAAAPDDFEKCH